jgi:dUTP pyrophosphatase
MYINIKKLTDTAIIPSKGSDSAAGYDLYLDQDSAYLGEGERKLLPTGIVLEIPEGYYGRIAPRSGLAHKHGIDVLAGVIDADYRGEIKVILINLGQSPVALSRGDRIAQLIIEKCHNVSFVESDESTNTTRGAGGFGHTGK